MTPRKVLLTRFASDDFTALVEHALTTLGVDQAVVVDNRLQDAVDRLAQLADRGRVVPELRDSRAGATFRELIVAPYRIVYRVDLTEVVVVAIVDHHRNLESLLRERALRRR